MHKKHILDVLDVQKNSIYSKQKSFVTLQMSLLVNLKCPF